MIPIDRFSVIRRDISNLYHYIEQQFDLDADKAAAYSEIDMKLMVVIRHLVVLLRDVAALEYDSCRIEDDDYLSLSSLQQRIYSIQDGIDQEFNTSRILAYSTPELALLFSVRQMADIIRRLIGVERR